MNAETEVHIPLTLYGANPDGSVSKEKFMSFLTRPQDWGHPRWRYEQVRFQWVTNANGFDFVCVWHMWADLPLKPKEMIQFFAQAFITPFMPGKPAELCGRTHLSEDDRWEKSWGVKPPVFEEQYEDDWGANYP